MAGHHTEPMRQQDKQWIRPTIRKPGDAATKTNTNTSLCKIISCHANTKLQIV